MSGNYDVGVLPMSELRHHMIVPDVYAPGAVPDWLALMLAAIRQGKQFQTDCSVYICHAQHVAHHNHSAAAAGGVAASAVASAAAAAGAASSSSSSNLKAGPAAAEGVMIPAETTEPISPSAGSLSSSLAPAGRNLAYQTWSRLAKNLWRLS
jgi:hypothetical protein